MSSPHFRLISRYLVKGTDTPATASMPKPYRFALYDLCHKMFFFDDETVGCPLFCVALAVFVLCFPAFLAAGT